MREQIAALRAVMKTHGIDAYLVPSGDFHGSEYVNKFFKCRQFLSGFTGSAGTLLVTDDWAGIWTDGRYFLQAEAQLAGSGITLMKEREPDVPSIPEFLAEHLPEGSCLGFDGRVVNCREGESFAAKYRLRTDLDLAGDVWTDRPALNAAEVYRLSTEVTGESSESKLFRLRSAMREMGADRHLLTSLEDIAWLYNLRGNDVKCTPVFFAFALVDGKKDRLYVLDESMRKGRLSEFLPETTEVLPYFQVFDDVKKLEGGKILLDKSGVSYAAAKAVPETVEIIDGQNPSTRMKSLKNDVEIECTKNAHRKDGAAMVEFIRWVKETVSAGAELSELDAAAYVKYCRSRQDGFRGLSFDTIAGYGPNGAIVHYSVTEETSLKLKPEGFLLVDSGGQYEDGTTDITRTIALGPLTDEMKEHYTRVLKGHIALAKARFSRTASGAELDELARRPLLDYGLNYNHGTGHGVGHLLSVHEGPQTISPRGTGCTFLPGMITSDEPGLYLEGKYGIRLENEVLCVEEEGMLRFEPLTWCPWERDAIAVELLSTEEIKWVDDYHKAVFDVLHPYLDEDTAAWLKAITRPLEA